jgi:integrase
LNLDGLTARNGRSTLGRTRPIGPGDPVFCSTAGTPLHYRNVVRRGLDKAIEAVGLNEEGRPKLRWDDLRHTYASLLISAGLNVVYVSRQLGHASPDITLKVYAHLFEEAEHAKQASAALEAVLGKAMESSGGERPRIGDLPGTERVAFLGGPATGG